VVGSGQMLQAALTTLAHHIDLDWLREAHRRTCKDGATGVDRQTVAESATNLERTTSAHCSNGPSRAAMWRRRSAECTSEG
jgi:RNA-directed DNA polymerase